MAAKVYVETTVVSYLMARRSRDMLVAAHQEITWDWWEASVGRFDLVASRLVVQEVRSGDPEAAQDRLDLLSRLKLLKVKKSALALAERLVASGAVPEKASADALHIAIAATHRVDYLVTWNCKHLANAVMRAKIDEVCLAAGCRPVIICTPEELLEV
jgi:hypothetical protein